MTVAIDDIREALPKYQGLTDNQIQKAINLAEGYLDGINPDWASFPKAEDIHLLASVSMTLKLHFPQTVNQYNALDNNVMEMVQSMWNSANMIKKKGRFMRVVEPDD
jgi:hypothetical protein